VQVPNHNGLHVLGLMGAGAGAGVLVFVDGTLAPHALPAQIQDILSAVPEGGPVQQIIYTAVIAMVQVVINADQLLGTGSGRIRQQAGLIAPDDSLYPCVHGPGIIAAPHLIYAQGVSLIGEHAGGMGVVVGHHGLYGRVGDGLGVPPGLPLQGPAHALTVFGAETDGAFLVVIKGHLMEQAGPQAGRLIVDAVVGAVFHLDGAGGVCRQRGGGQQTQHTDQHQQHGDHSLVWETNLSHTLFLSEK
ncbi:purine-nucleoside phosphorylase, partial [Dysosmobacter welbionis]